MKQIWNLANLEGEAPDAIGTGRRFSHLMAIAPNASSSIIMGNTSPSVEAYRANAYRQDTLSGAFLNKNKFLDKILKERCVMRIVTTKHGAVLSQTMDPFSTWIYWMTGKRTFSKRVWKLTKDGSWSTLTDKITLTKAQSINLFFRADTNVKYLHAVHFMAWKMGLKTLYYCRSEKIGKADKVAKKIEREVIKEARHEIDCRGERSV